MTTTKPIRPMQLVSFDEQKKIVINPQAVAWFSSVNQDKHIAIITVVGKYRTGKSYILNRVLLNQNSGFEVGPTINACTKGLWIWPELINNPDDPTIQYLVMDTEGLGSLEEGEQTDTKIFLMALLLSSYFIYNSVGNIDQKAVQNLSLIASLSKMLEDEKGKGKSQDILNCFPSFLWLVRDFALRLQDETGKTISPKQYLTNALKLQQGTSELVTRKNNIRKELTNFFKEKDCFMLIRPVDDQKKLQNMGSLKDSQLRPKFLELINQLRVKIMQQAKKKTFKGKSCTPGMLGELCQHFGESINKGTLPEIENNWNLVCKAECVRIEKKCHEDLERFLQKFDEKCNMKSFERQVDEKIKQLLKYYEKHALGTKQENRESIKRKMSEDSNKMKSKLASKINSAMDELFARTHQELETQICDAHSTIFDISDRYDQIIHQEISAANHATSSHLFQNCYEGFKATSMTYFSHFSQNQSFEKKLLQEKLTFYQTSVLQTERHLLKKIEAGQERERALKQNVFELEVELQQLQKQLNSQKV